MAVLIRTESQTLDLDPHGVWSPFIFRLELERAMDSALQRSRAARTRDARRERRQASRASAPPALVKRHRLPASPSIQLDGWYSDAPRATGEEQDVVPDTGEDAELRDATLYIERHPIPSQMSDEYLPYVRRFEEKFGRLPDDVVVAYRELDAIVEDEELVRHLHRTETRGPRGYGMTSTEMRRKWLMDARLRYAAMLTEALAKHRGRIGRAQAIQFPALKAEAQYARSVLAKWAFVDELARHGVWNPDAEETRKLKSALGSTYADAVEALVRRRDLAERGMLDRFTNELSA